MFKARPFFGVGIGNFSLIYPFYQTKSALATYGGSDHFIRQAHNEYFQFAAELGLVGLTVFIWFAFLLLRGLLRRIKTADKPRAAIIYLGLLGGILAALVTAGFGFNLQNESSALYFWFVVGMAGQIIGNGRGAVPYSWAPPPGVDPPTHRALPPSRLQLIVKLTVIALLAVVPRLIYRPLQAYWYQRKGLCLSMIGVLPSVYSKAEAKAAIPILEKSLKLYFPKWETHFLMGMAYSQLENFPAAEKAYLLCLRFNPNYSSAHYNLGNAYYFMDKYEQAIEQYSRCLRIDPSFTAAKNNLEIARKMQIRTLQ
jgi:tetratricopeptide (TPR) repeat protein